MQSGSSSQSGRNWGAAVKVRGRNQGAGVEAEAFGEQQLKRTQLGSSSRSGRNWGAAAEADTIS